MSSFDTARDVRLPGVVIESAYIDTSRLSTRMKNMVKHTLRIGYTEGGWNSKSRQLAKKIADARGLSMVDRSPYGFLPPPRKLYSDDVAAQVRELLDADKALYLVEMADYSESYKHTIRDRYALADAELRIHTGLEPRWISVRNPDLCAQMCSVFAAQRTPYLIEQAEKTCDMIDRGEPIAITISM